MDGITMQPHLAGHAGVCEIILDRPEVLNAINTAMATRLAQACAELAAESDSRAVVLSAAGDRAFCVGADLKERDRLSDAGLLAQREVFRAAFGGVLALPQPVIAAVHGYALGGGCELALCCDLIVTGRQVTADEAERIGLADRLAPTGKAGQHALELAQQIAANSPVAVRAAKQAIRHGAGIGLAAALDVEDAAWRKVAMSPDRREGIAAFNEKRAPVWPGR